MHPDATVLADVEGVALDSGLHHCRVEVEGCLGGLVSLSTEADALQEASCLMDTGQAAVLVELGWEPKSLRRGRLTVTAPSVQSA